MFKLNVPLEGKEYNIIIKKGILNELESHIDIDKKYVIITDSNIPKKYLNSILPQLNDPFVIKVPEGETSKSINVAYEIINKMIEASITRSATIIALGGGVIGDLAGFVASIFMRGIDFIQIPTTLLSQIDSSVGGKVGINADKMKNAIGSFKQPKMVLIDPYTLFTLDRRQLNNGIAEMIKYGLIKDKKLFNDLQSKDVFENIEEYIYSCVSIKTEIVLEDEFDYGLRQLLNFGHTIGHAIEQESNYKLLHGECVAIGMFLMAKGEMYEEDLKNLLIKYNLPYTHDYSVEALYNYIKTDKKVANKTLNIILVKEVGNGFIKPINIQDIKERI